MKIIKKKDSIRHKNSDKCIAIEYPAEDSDINTAVIELGGRYPDEGRCVNKECKEMAYIDSGKGMIEIEGEKSELGEGDLVFIEPGERFFWEGNMVMLVPCTPAWSPEQYEYVE